ncbi:hypothetical protein [Candidatus Liberibacter brunswickensis]|uniref:hypothetical protein n=1 Tax=Candidatus Liberibacter brunswickensis TaxID=1968796 RepID=UPI002FE04BA2
MNKNIALVPLLLSSISIISGCGESKSKEARKKDLMELAKKDVNKAEELKGDKVSPENKETPKDEEDSEDERIAELTATIRRGM